MFRFDPAFRAELRRNWLILAITFGCFFFGTSAPAFSLPFLFPEVIEEFGWTREQAALLASSKYAAGALAALMVGRLVDTVGAWFVLIGLLALGGGAMVSFLWMSDLSSYYLAGALLGICGPGAAVAIQVMISRTFHDSQGTALGLALLGTSLGSVVWPLFAAVAIDNLGWRTGFASLSAGIWLIVLPLLIFGLFSPSLHAGRKPQPSKAPLVNRAINLSEPSVWRTFKSWPFWALAIALFLTALVDQAFIQHQVLIFTDMGISREFVAMGISLIGVISFIGRVVVGNLLDGTSTKGLSLLYLTLSISALMAFWLVNPLIFICFITLRAVAHTAVILDCPIMVKHVFGAQNLGTLVGILSAFTYAGFAIGPWLMGRIFDTTGSYSAAFILFAILPVVASILIWTLKPIFWLELKALRQAQAPLSTNA